MECIQLSLFGRMSPELSALTAEKISAQCWKNLPAWNNQTLQFLDLRGGAALETSRDNHRRRMEFGLATAGQSIFRSGPA